MKLYNGYDIPSPGFGTYKTPDGEICIEAVRTAIEAGYTHIDTAAVYGNERSVGEGLRQSGADRSKLFITSKVWNTNRGYDNTLRSFEQSLSDLGLDYLDLFLIHWPANRQQFGDRADAINLDTWRAIERLVDEKVLRSPGLSNFYPLYMEPILANANIAPVVDQIEFHPGLLQTETLALCKANGILVEAWSPLGRGHLMDNPVICKIAEAHGVTPAQAVLRWCLQKDVLPLPKSVHSDRIRENIDIFGFTLSDEEMATLDAIPEVRYGSNPDTIAY